MHQRMTASGRPSGTDGSDFSYRMVVDSRYQKVARTKSTLRSFYLIQAVTLTVGFLWLKFLSTPEDLGSHQFEILAIGGCLISLIIGEIGRKRSRGLFLLFCIGTSSFGISYLLYCAVLKYLRFKSARNPSYWELPEVAFSLLASVFHALIICYTIQLVRNMSPPKRAA